MDDQTSDASVGGSASDMEQLIQTLIEAPGVADAIGAAEGTEFVAEAIDSAGRPLAVADAIEAAGGSAAIAEAIEAAGGAAAVGEAVATSRPAQDEGTTTSE